MTAKLIQVAVNTSDMAGSLLLYSEAFGFQNAGGQVLAGDVIPVQGLGRDARAIIWWMLTSDPLFQLELFNHTRPPQRPLRDDWSPADLGWSRIGVIPQDFDTALAALERAGAMPIGGIQRQDGRRRAAVRDPFVGVILEVIEGQDGDSIPIIDYIAASVSDLTSAEPFYRDQIGCALSDLDEPAEREALWGMAGAQRRGFVARAPGGGATVKLIEYATPRGRPRPWDYRASDQGLVNVAFGSNKKADAAEIWARLEAAGYSAPMFVENDLLLAGYVNDPEREVEIATLPDELKMELGLLPAPPFLTKLG